MCVAEINDTKKILCEMVLSLAKIAEKIEESEREENDRGDVNVLWWN